MKKLLLFTAVIVFALSVKAQGTWFASGTEPSVAAATEFNLGITNLKCMQSDATGVIGKTDTGAPAVTYNGINYTNEAFVQGATNGMYYAFRPTLSGTLDVSIKMGSAKKTYVLEVQDNLYLTTPGNLTELTTDFATSALITANAAYYTLPAVFDTYNNTTGTWDGTVAIQSTGANVYLVMSFPVTANKAYAVSCAGSKLMLRGVNYIVGGAGINNADAVSYKVSASSGRISINGLTNEKVSVIDIMGRQMTVANPSEIAVKPGAYMVKVNDNVTKILVL